MAHAPLVQLHGRRNAVAPTNRVAAGARPSVNTERRRTEGLAAELGLPWSDPTTWTDDDGSFTPSKRADQDRA